MSSSRSNSRAVSFAAGPSWRRAALYLALALLAQISFLHYLPFRGATVSPVLVAVVWYAIAAEMRGAAIYGLVAGFFEDMLDTGSGGAWTISTTLTAIVAGMVSRGFFADSMPLVGGIVALATLFRALVFWLIMEAQGYPAGFGWIHFHAALWQAAMNVTLVLIVMLIGRYRQAPDLP